MGRNLFGQMLTYLTTFGDVSLGFFIVTWYQTWYLCANLGSSKHPWLFQSPVQALQSQQVKSLNDSSGWPMVPMAAAGGLGRKDDWKGGEKKQCRSAQMRQSCQIWVWSSFTIPLVGAHGFEQGADLRAPLKGKSDWHHRWRCKWAARVKISLLEVNGTDVIGSFLGTLNFEDGLFQTRLRMSLKKRTTGVYSKIIKPVKQCTWIH